MKCEQQNDIKGRYSPRNKSNCLMKLNENKVGVSRKFQKLALKTSGKLIC